MKTAETVVKAVITGFKPFAAELIRPVTEEDVDTLLKIPIRRISLYDINKNRQEVEEIKELLKEIAKLLKNLTAYAISWLDGILAKLDEEKTRRKTEITGFNQVDVREVVKKDTALRYDSKTGYLGTAVPTGTELFKVSPYDRILILRKSGIYTVCDVPDKLFTDKGLRYCGSADKEELAKVLFTVIFRDPKTKYCFIKRCRISQFILNRDYFIMSEGMELLHVDTRKKFEFTLKYVQKPRVKILEETFNAADYEEKGVKSIGVRLAARETEKLIVSKTAASKKTPLRRRKHTEARPHYNDNGAYFLQHFGSRPCSARRCFGIRRGKSDCLYSRFFSALCGSNIEQYFALRFFCYGAFNVQKRAGGTRPFVYGLPRFFARP